MEITSRQKIILIKAIAKYLENGSEISSQEIADNFGSKYASSTVRREMNMLLNMGMLEEVHTSSGKIPTDLAFEWYAKNISFSNISEFSPSRYSSIFHRALSEISGDRGRAIKISEILSDLIQMPTFLSRKTSLEKLNGISKLFKNHTFTKDQLYYLGVILEKFDELLKAVFDRGNKNYHIFVGEEFPIGKGAGLSLMAMPVQNGSYYLGVLGPVAMNYHSVFGILDECASFLN